MCPHCRISFSSCDHVQPGAKLQQARLIGASDAVNRRRELQLMRASVGDCDPPLMVENGTRRLRGGGHPASVINTDHSRFVDICVIIDI